MSEASSSGSGLNPGRHIINDTTGADRRDALKRAARRAKRRQEAEGSDVTSNSGRTFTSYATSSKAKSTIGAESTTDASSVSGQDQEGHFSSSSRPKTSSRNKSRPRFPDMSDPEPSTRATSRASAESTSAREGHEKSSSSGPSKDFSPPDKSPSSKPSTERAFDGKPTDQSSYAAKDPSIKAAQQEKSNHTERDKASQPSRPTTEDPPNSPPQQNSSQQSSQTPHSRPDHNPRSPLFKTPLPGRLSDKTPPSSPQQEDTATNSQETKAKNLPRVWNDLRRNTLETLRSLSLKLKATASHVSTRFRVLVSLLTPFVERASNVFSDALALVFWICKLSASAFEMLVPKIMIHICMVVFVAMGIILFTLSLLVGILKDKYCDAITAMPYNMIPSPATAICLPSASQRDFASSSLLSDSLQGFQARIPGVWQYLANTLDSVDRDLVVAHHYDLLFNIEDFRPMYVEGLQESEVLERQFMRQQRALWFNVNHFIRSIHPDRPEQYWIFELLGFVNTALVREAQDAHEQLIEILDNSREQTMTFQRKLSEDSSDVLTPFVKLFNPKTTEFREKLTQMIMAKAAPDPHQDDPDDILGSSALWGASSDVVLDLLFHRHVMLVDDITWLSEKLAELRINLATLKGRRNVTKEAWEKQADELMEKAWAIASEWRGKLKEYFVVYD